VTRPSTTLLLDRLACSGTSAMVFAEIFEAFERHCADEETRFAIALALAIDMAPGGEEACAAEFELAARALDTLFSRLAQSGCWADVAVVAQLQCALMRLRWKGAA
jgi:hypothetical protein